MVSHRQEDLSRRGQHRRLTPPPFPYEYPRQSLCRSTFSPSSDRGIKFGREAVSNILCPDSPILSLSLSLPLSLSLSLRVRARIFLHPLSHYFATLSLRPLGVSGWRHDEVYALNPGRLNDRLRPRFFDS